MTTRIDSAAQRRAASPSELCVTVFTWVFTLLSALLSAAAGPARVDGPCGPAIAAAEARYQLPAGLLRAIAEVEAGRPDPRTGATEPWPWTTNAENQGLFFASREAAAAWVRSTEARGIASIDIGCMQVNLQYHPDAFASIEDAFDPVRNVDYAARFLLRLRTASADWAEAVGWYHSHTEALALQYRAQVARSYLGEPRASGRAYAALVMSRRERILHDLAQAWSATLPPPATGRTATWTEAAAVTPYGARPWTAATRPRPGARAAAPLRKPPPGPPSGNARPATDVAVTAAQAWTTVAERLWDAPSANGRPAGVPGRDIGREIATIDRGGP